MILEIILGILAILFVANCYVIWNTMKKMEQMEDWIDEYSTRMVNVNKTIKEELTIRNTLKRMMR